MTETIFIDAIEGARVAVFKGAGNQIGAASTPKMLAYILDTHNINADDDDLRVQNLEVRMHPIISQKIEDMFTDWYRKKYLGLERITKTLIDNEKHIITSKTESTVAL